MAPFIHTITTSLPFGMGKVNCYLVESEEKFILIDTGPSSQREHVEKTLAKAGCRPGNLQLILLTHGDFDHIGNAAFLRQKYDAPIAMHPDDSGMATEGNMFYNRRKPNLAIRMAIQIFSRLPSRDRFEPDITLQSSDRLDRFGLAAEILSLPGHSLGSIGVLLADSALFCGDLFENRDMPALNGLMDDIAAARKSVERLRELPVGTVYPGHGAPFLLQDFHL